MISCGLMHLYYTGVKSDNDDNDNDSYEEDDIVNCRYLLA